MCAFRYETRLPDIETIHPRIEPVVYGQGDRFGQLTQAQCQFFDDNGYLVLDGVLETEVDNILNEIPRLKKELKAHDELILEPNSQEVRSIFSPDKFSDHCKALSLHPHLLNNAMQLLDSQVYIHHARINIKAGLSGKSFPWHSDFETWHSEDGIPTMRILTGWVFLTDNNEFNGSLYVIPGSHKKFVSCLGETPKDNYKSSLRNQTYGVPSKAMLTELVNEHGIQGVYGKKGTVVFHEGNLLHGSPDNISPIDRTNIFFVYNSVENTPQNLASSKPRPEFLARHDFTALKPLS